MTGGWRRARAARPLAALLLAALALAACSGGGSRTGPRTVRVVMVGNPQMLDLQRLTPAGFTARTGIRVDFTVLPENNVRAAVNQDFSSQAGAYDVASVSNFEVPFYAKYGWLSPLDGVAADPAFDQRDILPAIAQGLTGDDGKVYAEPFYGESSFLMYRKDVLASLGLTMPERPTWPDVVRLAAALDHARPGMRGICLRGLPGWGEVIAPLTTVVNTVGGTWFSADWQAEVDSPQFRRATQLYVDLLREHGEPNPTSAGFSECLTAVQTGQAAMWYDATSAAGVLESRGSAVAGRMGYAPAPVVRTASSGWIYSWAWAVQRASQHQSDAAAFVAWAASKDYERLVGEQLGWSRVPAGKRASTYQLPDYRSAAAPFGGATLAAINSADPAHPGVQPRPTVGVQFVDVPEFTALGTLVSQEIARAIEGEQTVDQALRAGQRVAEQVAARHRGR